MSPPGTGLSVSSRMFTAVVQFGRSGNRICQVGTSRKINCIGVDSIAITQQFNTPSFGGNVEIHSALCCSEFREGYKAFSSKTPQEKTSAIYSRRRA